MKKWTVMLIPHDRGSTRTLILSNLHFVTLVGVLVVLTFTSTFFYQRHQIIASRAKTLERAHRELVLESARLLEKNQHADELDDILRRREAELRAEYEATIKTITTELADLYTLEAHARDNFGLIPRGARPQDSGDGAGGGSGKGGAPTGRGVFSSNSILTERLRPPQLIDGVTTPSADLIMQEIQLRTQSFNDLVSGMELEIDRIERIPSIWPLANGAGRISSQYGYRRDPFNNRLRHHDGLDLAAPHGTVIRASAKGVITGSSYENYLGNTIRIDHGNGIETVYAHLASRSVQNGDVVHRGQPIGRVGSTGRSTGPHLHYEVHVDGKTVNPENYITD